MVKIHKIFKTYKIYNYKNILIYNKFIIWDYFCLPFNIYMFLFGLFFILFSLRSLGCCYYFGRTEVHKGTCLLMGLSYNVAHP